MYLRKVGYALQSYAYAQLYCRTVCFYKQIIIPVHEKYKVTNMSCRSVSNEHTEHTYKWLVWQHVYAMQIHWYIQYIP